MGVITMDAAGFARAFMAGARCLDAKKEWINELNVFPVPDGDTGTNMSMTVMAAAREVGALESPNLRSVAKAISSGSLRGARGNSGVILSQLFRGLSKVIGECEEIDVLVLTQALDKAVETAYKAVMKPKEGTILTVARCMSERALELCTETDDLVYFCEEIVKCGDRVLLQTPEMLPVLKQAGVVDSGGQGLMEVMHGALDAIKGVEVDYYAKEGVASSGEGATGGMAGDAADASGVSDGIAAQAEQDIPFAYCTQFLIMPRRPLSTVQEEEFQKFLLSVGDSLVLVADDDIVKVHVHTNDPGMVLQRALSYGSLTTIIIENMRLERDEKVSAMKEKEMQERMRSGATDAAKASDSAMGVGEYAGGQEIATGIPNASRQHATPDKDFGVVAVSVGEGLDAIFRELGADAVVTGGQTMNPSTEDLLGAVEAVPARTVFLLPNNGNIVMAANVAAQICESRRVIVVPTKTVPQGVTALINFTPDGEPEEVAARMEAELGTVRSGEVTYAVRDTVIDGREIAENDFMGIADGSIAAVSKDLSEATVELLNQMIDEDSAIVTIYFGADATEEDADAIADKVAEANPQVEVEVHMGGQPVYYYIVSVE